MASAEPYGITKLKGMLLGDDNWAIVIDEENSYKNSRGIEMKRFLIQPHPHLIKQYPQLQKPGALTYRGMALWVEYPTYWIDDNNPSRTNAIVRVACAFDGRETPQTKKVKRYAEEIRMLQEELETMQLSNMQLSEENKSLIKEMKEKMKDIFELASMSQGGRHDYGPYEEPRPGEPR